MNLKGFTELLIRARKKRGLTQEEACFVIGISDTSTLSKWETGRDIPSNSMVAKMVQAYDDPILGYVYMQECTDVGKIILPPIIQADLDNLTLRFQKEYNDIRHVQMDMIDIACDGIVDEHEMERWGRAQKEIEDLAKVSIPLAIQNFMQQKMPSQGGNLERAYV